MGRGRYRKYIGGASVYRRWSHLEIVGLAEAIVRKTLLRTVGVNCEICALSHFKA